jgi:ATP-dependent Clp protease ATP-binding subunit ClpB
MTSNIGSHFIAETAIKGEPMSDAVKREVMDAVRGHFRPEFINRVDDIIIFHALTREQMRHIIDIQLRGLVKRLEDRKIHVALTDRAKDLLIEEAYDPTYGARPLKRTIQRRILDPLAIKVLEGEFREGDTVGIDSRAGALTFARAQPTVVH